MSEQILSVLGLQTVEEDGEQTVEDPFDLELWHFRDLIYGLADSQRDDIETIDKKIEQHILNLRAIQHLFRQDHPPAAQQFSSCGQIHATTWNSSSAINNGPVFNQQAELHNGSFSRVHILGESNVGHPDNYFFSTALPQVPTTIQSFPLDMVPVTIHEDRQGGSYARRSNNKRQKLITGTSEIPAVPMQQLESPKRYQKSRIYEYYTAITSTETIEQLETMCHDEHSLEICKFHQQHWSIRQTVKILNKLEDVEHRIFLLRKIFLLRLNKHRDDIEERLRSESIAQSSNRTGAARSRIETVAIDELLSQCYEEEAEQASCVATQARLNNNSKNRNALSKYLNAGRRLKEAVGSLGIGIIALLPAREGFKTQRQSFEYLHKNSCQALVQILQNDGRVRQASQLLTPWVQAIYEGNYPLPAVNFSNLRSILEGLS